MKPDAELLNDLRNETQQFVERLQKQIENKSNIVDVCALLDMKSNIEDVNTALTEIHNSIELRVEKEIYVPQMDDQRAVNEVLCAENCLARWFWKSGSLSVDGQAVPWEIQCANTCPDNFLWQEDKSTILTVEAGLYECSMAFFS